MVYHYGSLYTSRVPFDMDRFRAHLRAAREAKKVGRNTIAKKIGVSQSTIQSAEVGPDMPGIDTVARIIEAIPDLTLGRFFAQLDAAEPSARSQSSVLQSGESLIQDPAFPVEEAHADVAANYSETDVRDAFAVVFRILQASADRNVRPEGVQRSRRPASNPRAPKSKKGRARSRRVGRVPQK